MDQVSIENIHTGFKLIMGDQNCPFLGKTVILDSENPHVEAVLPF